MIMMIFILMMMIIIIIIIFFFQDKFPEMEILWFLTKAWNCGIHLYRYIEAMSTICK